MPLGAMQRLTLEAFQLMHRLAGAVQVSKLAVKAETGAPWSNASAHLVVLQVRNRVAEAVQVLKLNCQSNPKMFL